MVKQINATLEEFLKELIVGPNSYKGYIRLKFQENERANNGTLFSFYNKKPVFLNEVWSPDYFYVKMTLSSKGTAYIVNEVLDITNAVYQCLKNLQIKNLSLEDYINILQGKNKELIDGFIRVNVSKIDYNLHNIYKGSYNGKSVYIITDAAIEDYSDVYIKLQDVGRWYIASEMLYIPNAKEIYSSYKYVNNDMLSADRIKSNIIDEFCLCIRDKIPSEKLKELIELKSLCRKKYNEFSDKNKKEHLASIKNRNDYKKFLCDKFGFSEIKEDLFHTIIVWNYYNYDIDQDKFVSYTEKYYRDKCREEGEERDGYYISREYYTNEDIDTIRNIINENKELFDKLKELKIIKELEPREIYEIINNEMLPLYRKALLDLVSDIIKNSKLSYDEYIKHHIDNEMTKYSHLINEKNKETLKGIINNYKNILIENIDYIIEFIVDNADEILKNKNKENENLNRIGAIVKTNIMGVDYYALLSINGDKLDNVLNYYDFDFCWVKNIEEINNCILNEKINMDDYLYEINKLNKALYNALEEVEILYYVKFKIT